MLHCSLNHTYYQACVYKCTADSTAKVAGERMRLNHKIILKNVPMRPNCDAIGQINRAVVLLSLTNQLTGQMDLT